jgi:hypothetical protein
MFRGSPRLVLRSHAAAYPCRLSCFSVRRSLSSTFCFGLTHPSLQRTVRVGTPADQDRWRRDDFQRMTPQQRFDLAVRLRELTCPRRFPSNGSPPSDAVPQHDSRFAPNHPLTCRRPLGF